MAPLQLHNHDLDTIYIGASCPQRCPTFACIVCRTVLANCIPLKGLGLTPESYAAIDGAGFIGQTNARQVRLHLLTTYLLTKTFAAGLWCAC